MFPHKITVYNKYENEQNDIVWGYKTLNRTLVNDGVQQNAAFVGNVQTGTAAIYVPESVALANGYLSPEKYDAAEDKSGSFTFRIGDYVARGTVPLSAQTYTDPNDLMNAGVQGVFEITGVNIFDYGSLRHIKLTLR